jgi:hypothetical protein
VTRVPTVSASPAPFPRRRAWSTGHSIGRVLLAAVVLALLGAACSGSGAGGPTSTASFIVDGSKFTVDEGGSISVSVSGVPALHYSGALGCKGQFFHLAYSSRYDLFFRYTATDAVLAFANDVYHFGKPPTQQHGELVWDAKVPDSTGATHHLAARIQCPLPANSATLATGS